MYSVVWWGMLQHITYTVSVETVSLDFGQCPDIRLFVGWVHPLLSLATFKGFDSMRLHTVHSHISSSKSQNFWRMISPFFSMIKSLLPYC